MHTLTNLTKSQSYDLLKREFLRIVVSSGILYLSRSYLATRTIGGLTN